VKQSRESPALTYRRAPVLPEPASKPPKLTALEVMREQIEQEDARQRPKRYIPWG
jgi:hypothetical protein